MARNGWTWLEVTRHGWKLLKMAGNTVSVFFFFFISLFLEVFFDFSWLLLFLPVFFVVVIFRDVVYRLFA